MPPGSSTYSGTTLVSAPFSQLQRSALPHTSQHQTSNSGGLPPPSFHNGFSQGNSNDINPFAPTNGLAGGFGPGGGLGSGGTGLASRAAMAGFQHGAQLEQDQRHMREQMSRGSGSGGGSKNSIKSRIRDVWKPNFHQEMRALRELIDRYPYVSMVISYPLFAVTTETKRGRILNSQGSWLGQWVLLPTKQTITIRPCDAMSISSKSYNSA